MEYHVESVSVPWQLYVALRTTTRMDAISDVMGPLIGELFGWLGQRGIEPRGGPAVRYLFVGGEECEMEVFAPVAEEVAGEGRIYGGVRPAGEIARTLHVGPYDAMVGAYSAIALWMAANGFVPCGAWWEEYLTDPMAEPDPAKWETLVVAPISRG